MLTSSKTALPRTRILRTRLKGVSGTEVDRKFQVQFQPELVQGLDLSAFELALVSAKIDYSVSNGKDDVAFINYEFISKNPIESWSLIESLMNENQDIRKSSIVCCEGSKGWDNYLLLSHFDRNEELDEIKNH
ncbi:MAG: hypothetical protein AAF431_12385 [Pseudomonadota bacterium]